MAEDRRFMVGWGSIITILACVSLVVLQGWVTVFAGVGIFLVITGLCLAVLSAWGSKEPMLAGGGTAALVLGAAVYVIAQGFDTLVVLFIVILVAGLAIVAVGLKRR